MCCAQSPLCCQAMYQPHGLHHSWVARTLGLASHEMYFHQARAGQLIMVCL